MQVNLVPTVDLRDLIAPDLAGAPLITPLDFLKEFSSAELPVLAPHEQLVLAALARDVSPAVVVEFGTGQGFSGYIWAANTADTTRVVSVDLAPNLRGNYTSKILRDDNDVGRAYRAAPGAKKIEQVLLRSDEALPKSLELLKGTVDIVFVDGDHSYDGVLRDSRIGCVLARPDATFIWHDFYRFPAYLAEGKKRRGVYPFLNEVAANGHLDLYHVAGTYLVVGRRSWSVDEVDDPIQPAEAAGEMRERIIRMGEF